MYWLTVLNGAVIADTQAVRVSVVTYQFEAIGYTRIKVVKLINKSK
jgi:hypothetical protein